jgi:hypothetical protein
MKKSFFLLIAILTVGFNNLLAQYLPDGPKIVASNWIDFSGGGILQGTNVHLTNDGATLLFSGPYDSLEYGSCWIYERDSSGWNYQDKLVPDSVFGSAQISAIAMNRTKDRIAIGGGANNAGVGAIWIFDKVGSNWIRSQIISVTDTIGNSRLGSSLAMSPDGNTLISGGPEDNGIVGAVWIFEYSGSAYVRTQKIVPNDLVGIAQFGYLVSISENGNRFTASGPYDNGYIGAVWVFDKDSSNTWTQTGTKLVPSDYLDTPFVGTGLSLAPQGDVVAIGAQNNDVTSNNGIGPKGGTWIFSFDGTSWTQTTLRILGTDAQPLQGIFQGISVATSYSGDTLAVGGYGDENGEGSVWIFIKNGNNWLQSGSKINPVDEDNGAFGAHFGTSLYMNYSGSSFAVGASNDANYIGASWVYKTSPTLDLSKIVDINSSPIYFDGKNHLLFQQINKPATMFIHDLSGKLVLEKNINEDDNSFELPMYLSNGLFIASIISMDGNAIAKGKFIVAK